MCRALAGRFVREERRVNAPEHDVRAARPDLAADLVATPRVAGVDTDTDDIARLDRRELERVESFIDDERIAPPIARCRREDVQPARCDHRDAEGLGARVDQMNAWHGPPRHSTGSELAAGADAT